MILSVDLWPVGRVILNFPFIVQRTEVIVINNPGIEVVIVVQRI